MCGVEPVRRPMDPLLDPDGFKDSVVDLSQNPSIQRFASLLPRNRWVLVQQFFPSLIVPDPLTSLRAARVVCDGHGLSPDTPDSST